MNEPPPRSPRRPVTARTWEVPAGSNLTEELVPVTRSCLNPTNDLTNQPPCPVLQCVRRVCFSLPAQKHPVWAS